LTNSDNDPVSKSLEYLADNRIARKKLWSPAHEQENGITRRLGRRGRTNGRDVLRTEAGFGPRCAAAVKSQESSDGENRP